MMRRHDGEHEGRGHAIWALSLAAAMMSGLASCAGPTPAADDIGAGDDIGAEEPEDVSADDAAALPQAPPPPSLDAVCPPHQRIGKMQASSTCPSGGNLWQAQSLFGAGAPPSLAAYCTYTWQGAGAPTLSSLPMENGRPGATWTEPDCMAVAPMAGADTAEALVRGSLRSSFWNAVERPATLPAPSASGGDVRVIVVDSWPSPTAFGNSRHGVGMAGIIDDLTCDLLAGACPIQITPQLALNLLAPGVLDNMEGGYFGHQSRLATELFHAVQGWAASGPSSNLVFNLSVGWDPMYQPGATGAPRPSAQAVRDALEYAVCSGALVIAAAGNTSFGPAPLHGMIYPAAWQSDVAACAGSPQLVWAVGGLDALDRPLYNTRPSGMPALAAPGELAVGAAELSIGAADEGPFTGTSVSAAVATAAAATVWMYDRSLSASAVMAKVASGTAPLSLSATACGSGPCGPVGRISTCRAARTVAPGAPASVPCMTHGAGGGVMPRWTSAEVTAVEALATDTFLGPPLTHLIPAPGCSLSIETTAPIYVFPGPSACPLEQYANSVVSPTIDPQPVVDPCGACALAVNSPTDASLEIAVSRDLTSDVYAEVLTLYDSMGVPVQRFDIGSLLASSGAGSARSTALQAGNVYSLRVSATVPSYSSAVIEWVNAPNIQTASRVAVFPR